MKTTTKLFKTATVINTLFTKDFIFSNNIRFSTSTEIFTDLSAVLPIVKLPEKYPIINKFTYYKRVRNDPISNPSLNQSAIETKFKDLTSMIIELKSLGNSKREKFI